MIKRKLITLLGLLLICVLYVVPTVVIIGLLISTPTSCPTCPTPR